MNCPKCRDNILETEMEEESFLVFDKDKGEARTRRVELEFFCPVCKAVYVGEVTFKGLDIPD